MGKHYQNLLSRMFKRFTYFLFLFLAMIIKLKGDKQTFIVVTKEKNTTKNTDTDYRLPPTGNCGPKDCNIRCRKGERCWKDPTLVCKRAPCCPQWSCKPGLPCRIPARYCRGRYAPVCGIDGCEYHNHCEAGRHRVKIKCKGQCPCKPGCEIYNSTFYYEKGKNNLDGSAKQLSISACVKSCKRNKNCKYWSYHIKTGYCFLKRQKTKIKRWPGYTSGSRECDAQDLGRGDNIRENVTYLGKNLVHGRDNRQTYLSSCILSCKKTKSCYLWTYQHSTGYCFLKTETTGLWNKNGFTSGFIPIPTPGNCGPRECNIQCENEEECQN